MGGTDSGERDSLFLYRSVRERPVGVKGGHNPSWREVSQRSTGGKMMLVEKPGNPRIRNGIFSESYAKKNDTKMKT